MSNEIEGKWREDFLSVINYRGTAHCTNGQYADNRLHQKWIGYKAGRKHSEAEIEEWKWTQRSLHETYDQTLKDRDQRIAELEGLARELVPFADKVFHMSNPDSAWCIDALRIQEKATVMLGENND